MAFVFGEQLLLHAKDGATANFSSTHAAMQNPAKAFIRMRHTQRDAIEAKHNIQTKLTECHKTIWTNVGIVYPRGVILGEF